MFNYAEFVDRNSGYIEVKLQQKIKDTKILIAGCGVGSTIAEAAVRMGFEKLILADGDSINLHNLNRQTFSFSDIGKQKVHALSKKLLSINPQAQIEEFDGWINESTAPDLVKKCDMIFDTIDFLDLPGIVALHDQGEIQKKPIIFAASAGFGAVAIYFSVSRKCNFRSLFQLPEAGPVGKFSYVEQFGNAMTRLQKVMSKEVISAMTAALTHMQDGKQCPAPHLSIGSAAAASLSLTIATRILNGQPVCEAPEISTIDFGKICATQGVDISIK